MKTKNIIYGLYALFFIFLLVNIQWVESFQNYNPYTPLTNHNVDMPINTYYSCTNTCGPNSQCSITREQCTSDIDCYGCRPIIQKQNNAMISEDIIGENDAGKLTYNQNPRYSVLTTDIGTNASLYGNKNEKVPKPYLGIDKWTKSANYGLQNQRDEFSYKYSINPVKYKFTPHYPKRESVTGLFMDAGPLASNAYL